MKFFKSALLKLAIISGGLFGFSAIAAENNLVAGDHYEITAPKGKTEPVVEEFFNYACGACYSAEKFNSQFKANNKGVKFKYVPVELRPAWAIYVDAYYIGLKLNVLEQSHPKLFDRLNVKRQFFKGADDMKAFFLELGVDEAEYDKVAKSYWLKTQKRQAKQYAFKHKVTVTPTYLVNQRFKMNRAKFPSYEGFESAINTLAKE